MKWAAFKQLTVGEILDQVQLWENGQDPAGAKEFAEDFLDNGIFKFDDNSMLERLSDMAIGMGTDAYYTKLASSIGGIFTPVMNAKPLANLPI
jgi:hypothetical protein